jgi:tetratricopeptide (TPR) repeat protein
MRAYVFTDEALRKHAGRFVWLEIDTEKKQNAPFRTQFPVPALPTYFIVDPTTEKVVLRWVGGATVPQLEKLLEEGRRNVEAAGTPVAANRPTTGKSLEAADAALARADAFYGEGKDADAAKAYEEALSLAPGTWPGYGRAVESLLFAYYRTEQNEPAAKLAREAFPRLRETPSAANVAASGLERDLEMPADHPDRADLVTELEADARAVLANTSLAVAADDRSGVYISLLDARQAAEDSVGAHDVAVQWSRFLDGEAERAPNPNARTVFDSHRLSAYLELGEPERAVPMLQTSERDFPDDYNPPARLAVAYKAMGRWDDALAASDRALAKAYGPRRLGILRNRADICAASGDVEGARRTLQQAIDEAEALPEGQRSESTIAGLKKKLDGLGKS